MPNVSPRESAIASMTLSMPVVVGVLLAVMVLMAPTIGAVPRPPRPTVERVKIFDCEPNSRTLQERVNDWFFVASGEVRIVGRTFSASMGKQPCYSAAIFYEKLVERSADEKSPAEKP